MAGNAQQDILRKLEELLSLDNSDKEYLVDSLLKDREIKTKISERLSNVVENMITHEDSSGLIKNVIGKIVERQMEELLKQYKNAFVEEIEQAYIAKTSDLKTDIELQAKTFSGKVETELRAVLATDVATALYEQLTSPKK